MDDIQIQCCRCRSKHLYSERIDVPSKRFKSATESTCPKCGGKSFYDLSPWLAWCWASGLIEFGEKAPEGSIVIAQGPRSSIVAVVSVKARHAYDRSLLVPGVPEADDEGEAANALSTWLSWCAKGNGKKIQKDVVFVEEKEKVHG